MYGECINKDAKEEKEKEKKGHFTYVTWKY